MENYIGIREPADTKTIEQQLLRILQSHHQLIHSVHRTGHARFRRGPSDQSTSSQSQPLKPVQAKSNPSKYAESKSELKITEEQCKSTNSSGSSGKSTITGGEEGTVSNGNGLITGAPVPRVYSTGKPPLPSTHRKRCREIVQADVKHLKSRGCHCCKRRKTVEIKTATKGGSSSIPSDEYSWRKYDQKLIPGTHFPRGYYKCNSVKGCPARKHVMRSQNDPTVVIVTYEGKHHHHRRMVRPDEGLSRLNTTVGVLVNSR